MKLLACLLCSFCIVVTAGNSSREVERCIRFEDNGACACSHNSAGQVACHHNRSMIVIQPCYCMYYDSTQNLSIVGHCYYSCYTGTRREITSSIQFNNDICSRYGDLNRRGRFCGQCSETYGLAVYSYQLFGCIPCQNYGYKNWLRYFAVALLPLTVFYIAAVLSSFNITSSSFNGIVFAIQCVLSPLMVTTIQGGKILLSDYRTVLSEMKAATSIFCAVNLDFFRLAYPPFCLHPDAKFFHIMSLDYLVALYPFFLIFMTFVLVTAYDKQYRLVVWMWRPVQRCVRWHRNTWNIRTSLIEIFATFILFSYVKILGVSVQILSFTATHDVAGNKLKDYYTLYDGAIKYFGPEHLPFALLAIAISSVFVVLPFFLLAVYPCRCFHKCLNYCRMRSQTLHVFMDAFQGSYRTEPRDLRYFSVFYLLLRILLAMQFQFFTSMLMYLTSGILFISAAAIVALFQPYKVKVHNAIDIVLLLLLGVFFASYHASIMMDQPPNFLRAIQYICIILLLLNFISLLAWKLLGGKCKAIAQKAKVTWNSIFRHTAEERRGEECVESFDRDTGEANSYTPLLREQNPTY